MAADSQPLPETPLREELQPPVTPSLSDDSTTCARMSDWLGSEPAAGGLIRIWWNKRFPGDEVVAREYASEITSVIWPKLRELKGPPGPNQSQMRPPLTMRSEWVETLKCKTMQHSLAVDIFIGAASPTKNGRPVKPSEKPLGEAYRYPKADVFLEIRNPPTVVFGVIAGDGFTSVDPPRYTLAHEIFHAMQYAYKVGQNYDWFREATAFWSEYYVYPDDDPVEKWRHDRVAKRFLDNPTVSLDQGDHGQNAAAYLYFYYLTGPQRKSAYLIPQMWEKAEEIFSSNPFLNSLRAVDSVSPFDRNWWFFSRLNWNREPRPSWDPKSWSWYQQHLGELTASCKELDANKVLTENSGCVDLEIDLPHLSTRYYRFTNFSNVRSVVLLPPPGAQQAGFLRHHWMSKADRWYEGGAPQAQWFNFWYPTQRMSELVLIVANSSWKTEDEKSIAGWRLRICMSNICRGEWVGTSTFRQEIKTNGDDYVITAEATATFMPDPVSEMHGPAPVSANGTAYVFKHGTVRYQAWGTTEYGRCTVSGKETHVLPSGSDGGYLFIYSWPDAPDHREYWSMAYDPQPFEPKIECPPDFAPSTRSERGRSSGLYLLPFNLRQKVTDDGKFLRGTHRMGSATWTWSFQSGSGPTTIPSPIYSGKTNIAGWSAGPVDVTLAAVGDSTIQGITYSAAGAQPMETTTVSGSTTTVHVSAEGLTTLSYFAADEAGNAEPPTTFDVKIDQSAPTIAAYMWPQPDADGWHHSDVTVMLEANDSLSGSAYLTYSASGAETIPETTVEKPDIVSVTIAAPGTTVLSVTAIDQVGNKSAPQLITARIAQPA